MSATELGCGCAAFVGPSPNDLPDHKYSFAMKYLPENWYASLSKRAVSRPSGIGFWLGLAAFVLILNLYAPAEPTVIERILASGIILVAFGAIWRWIYRGGGEAEFGFLPVVLIVYFLEYALPIFTLKVYSMDVFTTESLAASSVEKSLLLASIGLICILIGYYHPWRRLVARALPKPRLRWRNKNAVQLMSLCFAALALIVFVITLQTKLSSEIQAYVNLPSEFFYLAIVALLILQLEGELTWRYAALLWIVLIPLRALIGLAQGALGFAMIEAAALLITYATIKRQIPWIVFVIGFAAFFFMQPIKGLMRTMVFAGRAANSEQDQSQKFSALAATGEQGLAVVESLDPGDLLAIATNRLASIMVLSQVVELTPEDVPYWNGASYYPFMFLVIPRFLYPEKPSELPGNVLAHQYGMLAPENWEVSINLMQLLELYGNFGPLGVLLGSILIGVIYRTINDLFLHQGAGLGALVGGIYLFTHLTDIENATSSIFGGLLLESVVIMLFHFSIRFTEHVFAAHRLHGTVHLGEVVAKLEAAERRA
jgi:hypothetical protein